MRVLSLILILALQMAAQWTGSGSNGSDGALNLGANTPGVVNSVLRFDPVALGLDSDGDNIYHFTSITIRDNLLVVFSANGMRHPGPVVFLSSGPVNIQGRLSFSGESGHQSEANEAVRRPSVPGPGGYPGGAGAKVGGVAMPGLGPGGGKVAVPASNGCPGAFVTNAIPSWCNGVGASTTYGNSLIQPLVGGSGGSGGTFRGQLVGGGGGAGGGAIRISSDAHIVFGSGVNASQQAQGCSTSYYIDAAGGNGNTNAGSGSGGSIHLQAPLLGGCHTHLYAEGGSTPSFGDASKGRIRLDFTNNLGMGVFQIAALTGPLVDVPLPTNPARIRISSINGVSVPAQPKFEYVTPDVSTNSGSPVPVVIEGSNVPINTPITVYLTSEGGADVATAQVNLTGTIANSTATINVTLPQGVTRLIARAVW